MEYEPGPVRAKTLKVLRNLLAKHDCDTRYVEVVSQWNKTPLHYRCSVHDELGVVS